MIQHGFARHGRHWYHWIPTLSQHFRVIRRDARGHGLSSYPDEKKRLQIYHGNNSGRDNRHNGLTGIKKKAFLGRVNERDGRRSAGAKYPHRLLSLTICASPTYLPPAALKMFAFGCSSWPNACLELGSRGWAEALASAPGTLSMPNKEYVKWWIDQVAVSTTQGLAGYATFLSSADGRPFLEKISIPMLILAQAKSAATKLEGQIEIQIQIKGSKLVVIHGEGHEIFVQKPRECQEALVEFIRALSKKRNV